jgi:hypothetical protein
MAISIYMSVTAMDPEDRGVLADRLVEAAHGKIREVGGGTGFGSSAQSDIDFETDLVDPEEVMKLAALLWTSVGPITGGQIEVSVVAVVKGVE